jgi:predicted phage-related endonuclease
MRRIGGSDIAKLLGLSKYGNAADVYLRIVEGLEDEWNPRMERGAAVEPELRAYAQNFLGLELEDVASDYHDHPTLEFARAQVDDLARWNGMPVAVDYKSQSRWVKGWGAADSDEVPASIHAQIAWEMLCADRELGLLVVGFGDDAPAPVLFSVSHVVTYQVERDERFEALCIQTARDFWEGHVIPRVPPSVKPLGKKQRKAS